LKGFPTSVLAAPVLLCKFSFDSAWLAKNLFAVAVAVAAVLLLLLCCC